MRRRSKPLPTPDYRTLDLNRAWDVWTWAQILGCTEDELRATVGAIGPKIADLKKHYGKDP